jgi:hypothetical protein
VYALDIVPEHHSVVLLFISVLVHAHLPQILHHDLLSLKFIVSRIHGAVFSSSKTVLGNERFVTIDTPPEYEPRSHENFFTEPFVDLHEVLDEV